MWAVWLGRLAQVGICSVLAAVPRSEGLIHGVVSLDPDEAEARAPLPKDAEPFINHVESRLRRWDARLQRAQSQMHQLPANSTRRIRLSSRLEEMGAQISYVRSDLIALAAEGDTDDVVRQRIEARLADVQRIYDREIVN